MSATLAPPPNRYRAPLAEAMRRQAQRAVEAPVPRADTGAPVVRLVFVLLAGGYALRQWLGLVGTTPHHAVVLATGTGLLLGAALVAAARTRRLATRVLVTACVVLLMVVSLMVFDLPCPVSSVAECSAPRYRVSAKAWCGCSAAVLPALPWT